jgi:hypothetical protein
MNLFETEELESARIAWDEARRALAEDRTSLKAALKERDEIRSFRDKTKRAWDKLSDDAKDMVDWTATYMGGCARASTFFRTLDETIETVVGKRGNSGQAQFVTPDENVSGPIEIEAIRAVAKALGLRGYGGGDRAPATETTLTPAEEKLLTICRIFDPRVGPAQVRSALKGLESQRVRRSS